MYPLDGVRIPNSRVIPAGKREMTEKLCLANGSVVAPEVVGLGREDQAEDG